MAEPRSELLKWLYGLTGVDPLIAIDDGGLALVVVGYGDVYFEIGGIPDEYPTTVEGLHERYGGAWGACPEFPRNEWKSEAGAGNTQLGYWEWVLRQIEAYKWER